jgi:cysteine desulfurase
MPRHYLDHAASTPLLDVAVDAITRELSRVGNPSSSHTSGRAARRVVEESRESIAACVGAQPREVIFTSGGTEADNLAVKGGYWAARHRDPARTGLVTSVVEHHAVLDTVEWLAAEDGAKLTLLPVDGQGRLDPESATQALGPETALVSVMWANNEVGTLQPVRRFAARAAEVGALSHSDAVQAVGHVPVDFAASGLDTLSFTAHKLGGPVGVGALLVKREVSLTATQHGGGQERDVRSGTLAVAAIAGFAAAVRAAVADLEAERQRVSALRRTLIDGIRAIVDDAVVNGPSDPLEALPGVASVILPGCEAQSLLMLLDAAGIDCSAGSACSAGVTRPSHVLTALGLSERETRSSVRFSLGHSSTAADVAAVLAALPDAVARTRRVGAWSD